MAVEIGLEPCGEVHRLDRGVSGLLVFAKALPMAERLATHAYPEPNSGCWLWGGPTFVTGYGAVVVNGASKSAHRLAYEVANGPIPPGMFVCHKCDVPGCVNPDHLWLGTRGENNRDVPHLVGK